MTEHMAFTRGKEQRAIRVFVSSTFHDMQEEREELAKRVFPQLCKLCEQRGVTWGEVDLRWGVPDEQKAEGKVLPICLEEIRRCRPYFIGLLGERYGWVPEQIPQELVEQEPWLAEHLARSVTELEIFHGVLRERLVDHYRRIGDLVNLPGSLGNQALILKDKGDLDGAMKLHKEEEHLCRELGNKDGLAISLISQALFLKKLYEENLRKYGEL